MTTTQSLTDWITGTGVILTLIVSIWNLTVTRRTAAHSRFSNIITAERLKWITDARAATSKFCGAVESWRLAQIQTSTPAMNILDEIHRTSFHIRLLLDPANNEARAIEEAILKVEGLVAQAVTTGLGAMLNKVTNLMRDHLNEEWRKSKQEADKGRVS
jgi:hypothetical protein